MAKPFIRMPIGGKSEEWELVDPVIAAALRSQERQTAMAFYLPEPPVPDIEGFLGATSRWDVEWGPSVNLNPNRRQRLAMKAREMARRVKDAVAILRGTKIAVDEDEYWEEF